MGDDSLWWCSGWMSHSHQATSIKPHRLLQPERLVFSCFTGYCWSWILFRDVYVGWPGSVHDARVFVKIFKLGREGNILQGEKITIGEVDVPIFLVADSAYPLSTWLMKLFPQGSTLTQGQKNFNYNLSRARIVVENAYGRLKAKWRLCKSNDMVIEHIPTVITACCILHNICEAHGNWFNEKWIEERDLLEQPPSAGTTAVTSDAATTIHNSLVEYYS